MTTRKIRIELYEDGELIVAYDTIDDDYTIENAREDYAGATVTIMEENNA